MTELSIASGPPLETDPCLVGRSMTLGGFLREIAARSTDDEAIVTPDERLSYSALEARSLGIARSLVAHGVGKSSRVAILLPNCPTWPAAFLGATSIGAVAVAINTFAPDDDVEHMLRASDSELLLTDASTVSRLLEGDLVRRHPLLSPGTTDRRDVTLPAFRETLLLDDDLLGHGVSVDPDLVQALTADVVGDDDALVMFTSGSTGQSKAVLHTHRSICIQSLRWALVEDHHRGDRVWTTAPFFWSSGLVRSLGGPLAGGATVVVQPHFDAGEALDLLERERVTAILSRPHLDHRILDHPDFARHDLSRVLKLYEQSPMRTVLFGDEPGPRVGAYGMTETMTIVSYRRSDDPRDDPASGDVLSGSTIRVADPDTGVTLPRGTTGRIWVRGATLMRGYCKRDRRETFDDDGFFATSDAGFIDDVGRLHWTGRLDNVIKVAGVNVSPTDIERQLAGWEALMAYSAFPIPHPTLGAALVLCAAKAEPNERVGPVDEVTIQDYLRGRLATYQMPRAIVMIDRSEVPFTSTLKVNVKAMQLLAFPRLIEQLDESWANHVREQQSSETLPGIPANADPAPEPQPEPAKDDL